jgi:hypothetical protein
MQTPLPSNDTLVEHSAAVPWHEIERQRRHFNEALKALAAEQADDDLPLESLSDAVGAPVTAYYSASDKGNILLANINGRAYMLGSAVSSRYRSGKTLTQSIVPYNLNPSVNHTNLDETDDTTTRMRAIGAELAGLLHPDGGRRVRMKFRLHPHIPVLRPQNGHHATD